MSFETVLARIGRKGLQLSGSTDELEPTSALVFKNLRSRLAGPIEPRPGYLVLGTGAGAADVHTILRVDDTARADWTRLFGAGTQLYGGRDAVTGLINLTAQFGTNLSGQPLTLLPYRSVLTGDPWVIVVDSTGVYKVRKNGTDWQAIELGLTAPAAIANAEISELLTTGICAFDASDSTTKTLWTGYSGYDFSETPIEVNAEPTIEDITGLSGAAVEVTFKKGSAAKGYYSWVGAALQRDLTKLQGGTVDATDQDYMHLWVRAADPQYLEELRIYFVCSQGFDPAVVPGTSDESNTDAFVKSIRPHDFQNYIELVEDALTAAQRARQNKELDEYVRRDGNDPIINQPEVQPQPDSLLSFEIAPLVTDPTGSYSGRIQSSGLTTGASEQLFPGRGAWSEFGGLGRPLRRGEFTRIGRNGEYNWSTVTGMVILAVTTEAQDVAVAFDDWFLMGGYGPDTGAAEAIPLDYRFTHYDTRTGAESNPSPVFTDDDRLQPLRSRLTLSGTPYGGASAAFMRQRFYRRGGLLADDWRFVGQSDVDGGQVIDSLSDTSVQAAGVLEQDNYRPVQSVDLNGAAVRSNPTTVFGPLDGVLVAVGDQYRPGHIIWSKIENPDAWPLENAWEVCPPSEQLLNGCIYGTGGYVFSRKRLYALQSNGEGALVAQATEGTPGLAARRGLAVTPFGMAYVALDGIRLTTGGASKVLSWQIDPLFRGKTVEGLKPINLANESAIQLQSHNTELFFFYADSSGTRCTLVYDFVDEQWREYAYANRMATAHHEDTGGALLLGSVGTGTVFLEGGATDNGTAIACRIKTGHWDMGDARRDKTLGDVVIDADIPTGVDLLLTTYINTDVAVNPQLTKQGLSGRRRFMFDPFGEIPQKARNVALDLQWTSTASPKIWFAGVSVAPEPDMTFMRATTWEPLGADGQSGYLTGVTLVVDTNGEDKRFIVEVGDGQNKLSASQITVLTPGRRRMHYSWLAVRADQVRLRPLDPCDAVMLYKVEWHVEAEPVKVSKWDSNHESKGDTYYTGLDIVCDTQGQSKTVEIYVDQTLVATRTISANGKRLVHLTFGPGRGHIYRFLSRDQVPARLYGWTWHLDPEPSEQTNWNQNFTIGGHLSDKWIKGVLLECDTFGQNKTLEVQIDGVTVETITVNQNGRGVKHIALSGQYKGRMLRLLPTDGNPGRIYQPPQWIFDLEPLALTRWETQELDFRLGRWFLPLSALITLRSTAEVTLTVTAYGERGAVINISSYTMASTEGNKVQDFVGFNAVKCALVKFVFVSAVPFALYREESSVRLLPWGTSTDLIRPFGNDDLDQARGMGNATIAAATPGGA